MSTSPMMQQYHDAKAACPDALLLFRMGDFYELFFDDAKQAAQVLGLTLTSRDKGENPVPMAGFPHHQLEGYLAKLIARGMRAAVCDQVEDPKQAKGIVRREVTRIVTPGTLTDDALLDPRQSNYLAAVVTGDDKRGGGKAGLAWVELSTGRFFAATCQQQRLGDELARVGPAECLIAEEQTPGAELLSLEIPLTKRPLWTFGSEASHKALAEHFGVQTLEGFGFDDGDDLGIRAAGAVLDYLQETQKASLAHIRRLAPYRRGTTLEIDQATRRSLEITRTIRDGRREGSLLAVLDRSVTAMGSRELAHWMANPLAEIPAIEARHDAVEEFIAAAQVCGQLRESQRDIYDQERLVARVTTGRASPRDLRFVARTLAAIPAIKAQLAERASGLAAELQDRLDECPELRAALESSLEDDCPLSPRDGGFIRRGADAAIDEL
ncbi:MAG: DNA mismatch repair protein MutS, partial [Planctomycetales bacterium]|nr:DNA mismatch repair protein MutS [Planctomycetales bacterium]